MDTVIRTAAGALLVISIAGIIAGMFQIGKGQGPVYTADYYAGRVFRSILAILIVGRVFGWW